MKPFMRVTFLIVASWLAAGVAQALEFTQAYNLQTEEGEQVGMLVGLPDFKLGHGGCVFALTPARPELANSPLGLAITQAKVGGQAQWDKLEEALVVRLKGMSVMKFNDAGDIIDPMGRVIGKAVAVPEKQR